MTLKTITDTELEAILDKHKKWLCGDADGERAILSGYDLRGLDLSELDLFECDLRGSDISGCNMYNACLPLWCGGLHFRADRLFVAQLAYHLCSILCDDEEVKAVQRSLYAFANEFARSRYDLRDKLYPESER